MLPNPNPVKVKDGMNRVLNDAPLGLNQPRNGWRAYMHITALSCARKTEIYSPYSPYSRVSQTPSPSSSPPSNPIHTPHSPTRPAARKATEEYVYCLSMNINIITVAIP